MEEDDASLSTLDCTIVYYIKQLSPSDAASSKQIKLPKTEARRFCGELRHKQRSMVTVLDHQHVCWEFLCTCYGCQYALSRVAVFCNTYQLRAGQYLLFYRDSNRRLRIAVTGSVPPKLRQQVYSSHHLKRSYSQMAAGHAFCSTDYAAPATDAHSAQQQRQQQHSPIAAVDAVSQSSRDQMCIQKEVKHLQLTSSQAIRLKQQQQYKVHHTWDTQQQQQQYNVLHARGTQQQRQYSVPHAYHSQQQQQQQHVSPAGPAATVHPAAEAHLCVQQQQQGSQNSSDSSSSRQLLGVRPEAQVLGGSNSGVVSGRSFTPASTDVGSLTDTPAWKQLITQQQQQQGADTLAGSTAAANTRLPAAVANWVETAAVAVGAAYTDGQHPGGIRASATATATKSATTGATTAASRSSSSPGSSLVCHEQLLDSPSVPAPVLLAKARAKQTDSSQRERLKLWWRAVNSSAAGSAAAAAATAAAAAAELKAPPGNHLVAASASLGGNNSCQGDNQAAMLLPKGTVGPGGSITTALSVTTPLHSTQQGSDPPSSSSSKLSAMQISNSEKGLDHNSGSCHVNLKGSSASSTERLQTALLPKLHFKQQQRQQQQQQLLGCTASVAPHSLGAAAGNAHCTSPPGCGPDKQHTSQNVPGWGPDKHCIGSTLPAAVQPAAAELASPWGLKISVTSSSTTHDATVAAASAVAVTKGYLGSAVQSTVQDNAFCCGLLQGASRQWQLQLSSSTTAAAPLKPAARGFRGVDPESLDKMLTACNQLDVVEEAPAAVAAEGVADPTATLLASALLFARHAPQLACGYSGQQQQHSITAANLHTAKGSRIVASSNPRIPHCFDSFSCNGSSRATAMQQALHQLHQTHYAGRSNQMGSDQLLPLFQSGPMLPCAAASSVRLKQQQQQEHGKAGTQQQQMHASSTHLHLQQQLHFEADEWSAVSSLLMLAQRSH